MYPYTLDANSTSALIEVAEEQLDRLDRLGHNGPWNDHAVTRLRSLADITEVMHTIEDRRDAAEVMVFVAVSRADEAAREVYLGLQDVMNNVESNVSYKETVDSLTTDDEAALAVVEAGYNIGLMIDPGRYRPQV